MLSVNNYQNGNQVSIQNQISTTSGPPSFRRYAVSDSYSQSSAKTKRLAIGAASFVVPGLGQVINGETTKGLAFFFGSVCNYLLFFRNRNHMLLGSIGRLGIGGWAAHDAYKKA